MSKKIVIWDPRALYWDGSIIDEVTARTLESRGVVCLAASTELLTRSGAGGYTKRCWGAGWPLSYAMPRMSCPLTLFIPAIPNADAPPRVLSWALRLVPDSQHEKAAADGETFTRGSIRLVADSSQVLARISTVAPNEAPIDGAQLGTWDEHGGWTRSGSGRITPQTDGYYGFGIYGTMPGVRVAWAAASITG
jgi:hypothetical protein